jgi:methylthioribose-1-phosphate isomerase
MNIDGRAWRTIWLEEGGRSVGVIDQTLLPHRFSTRSLTTHDQAAEASPTMVVRGAAGRQRAAQAAGGAA